MNSLTGRAVLITGASSGIGRAAAAAFARRGCHILLAARRMDLLEALAADLNDRFPQCECAPLHLDLTHPEDVLSSVERGRASLDRIDILVNNAGLGEFDWLEALDEKAGIVDPIAVNLTGAILACRAVLPGMIEARSGHILFVGSLASLVAMPTYGIYAATKAGLLRFADSLRREVHMHGLHVSTLLPGAVDTGFARESIGRRRTGIQTPPRWLLTPQAVGEAVARLAERPRRMWILPAWMRPMLWFAQAFPGVVDRIVEIGFVRRERTAG